jgi:hypothetical protein
MRDRIRWPNWARMGPVPFLLAILVASSRLGSSSGDACLDQLANTCADYRHAHACCGVCRGVDSHGVRAHNRVAPLQYGLLEKCMWYLNLPKWAVQVPVMPPAGCTKKEIRDFCRMSSNLPDGSAGLSVDLNPHTYGNDGEYVIGGPSDPDLGGVNVSVSYGCRILVSVRLDHRSAIQAHSYTYWPPVR